MQKPRESTNKKSRHLDFPRGRAASPAAPGEANHSGIRRNPRIAPQTKQAPGARGTARVWDPFESSDANRTATTEEPQAQCKSRGKAQTKNPGIWTFKGTRGFPRRPRGNKPFGDQTNPIIDVGGSPGRERETQHSSRKTRAGASRMARATDKPDTGAGAHNKPTFDQRAPEIEEETCDAGRVGAIYAAEAAARPRNAVRGPAHIADNPLPYRVRPGRRVGDAGHTEFVRAYRVRPGRRIGHAGHTEFVQTYRVRHGR